MVYPSSSAEFSSGGLSETLRSIAEDNVAQVRDSYAKVRDAVQAGSESVGAAFETTAFNTEAYTAKVLELSRINTESALEFGIQLLNTTSLPDAIELWSGCARRQVEGFVTQSRELSELGQQMLGAVGAAANHEAAKGSNS